MPPVATVAADHPHKGDDTRDVSTRLEGVKVPPILAWEATMTSAAYGSRENVAA